MKNKYLIELIVPDIEMSFSLYIPISKKIGNAINLLCKAVSDFTNGSYKYDKRKMLYNANTGEKYQPNELIFNTSIKNGEKLILL